jgi:hypothetical protein
MTGREVRALLIHDSVWPHVVACLKLRGIEVHGPMPLEEDLGTDVWGMRPITYPPAVNDQQN